ncbi:MAG: hypothetical protein CM1200mP39_01560 [Dehalococcoidia bacterium]|nr:MAG: hypothetical protein CM1200mP39_01560 [Dehalococcoidia bacterium]
MDILRASQQAKGTYSGIYLKFYLIKEDPVDIYLQTNDAEFIYRVTTTSQMHEEDLQLTTSNDAQITLVTCWPPRIYDQRIIVNATLIAYRYL